LAWFSGPSAPMTSGVMSAASSPSAMLIDSASRRSEANLTMRKWVCRKAARTLWLADAVRSDGCAERADPDRRLTLLPRGIHLRDPEPLKRLKQGNCILIVQLGQDGPEV